MQMVTENAGPVHAAFNDGKSALTHPVDCFFRGEMLEIRSAGGEILAVWPRDTLVAEASKAALLRLRCVPDTGQRLVAHDSAAAGRLREFVAPVVERRRRNLRKNWFLGVAALWLVLAGLWLALPQVVKLAVAAIPQAWEQGFGERTRDTVGRIISGKYYGDIPWRNAGPGYEALQRLTTRLAGPEGEGPLPFAVTVLEADMVNAFALPGGAIVVTTGLLRQCASPEELAGVLAHEMAHVTERHIMQRLVREQIVGVVFKLLLGGADLAGMAYRAGESVVSGSFSREAEREADILGVERLARARINPEGIALFFAGLPRLGKERFSYFDSHPLLQDRRDYMLREAAAFAGPFTPALDPADWKAVQRFARSGTAGK